MAGPGRDDARRRLPRRQAAAEVADPIDPLLAARCSRPRTTAPACVFVDIATQPGLGPLRGSMDFSFRDDSLNARNAFQPTKGPEQTQQYTFNLSGTLLKERTSFSLSAGGASLYDSANIYAAVPDGTRGWPVRRPSDRLNFNAARRSRAEQVAHAARDRSSRTTTISGNLGVGSYDLAGARLRRATVDETHAAAVGERTAGAHRGSPSRACRSAAPSSDSRRPRSRRRRSACSTRSPPAARSRRAAARSTDIEYATNVDWARGRHAIRIGTLVEGGFYRSDNRTNYLGTFTFASLDDYDAGRPATYTRRAGDPLVEYSQWQAGVLRPGRLARAQEPHAQRRRPPGVADAPRRRWNLAPRGGFTWSPFKNGKTTVRGRRRHLLRLARCRQSTSRRSASTACTSRTWSSSNPGYPDPFAGGVDAGSPAGEQVHARATGSSCRSARSANVARDAAVLADRRRQR